MRRILEIVLTVLLLLILVGIIYGFVISTQNNDPAVPSHAPDAPAAAPETLEASPKPSASPTPTPGPTGSGEVATTQPSSSNHAPASSAPPSHPANAQELTEAEKEALLDKVLLVDIESLPFSDIMLYDLHNITEESIEQEPYNYTFYDTFDLEDFSGKSGYYGDTTIFKRGEQEVSFNPFSKIVNAVYQEFSSRNTSLSAAEAYEVYKLLVNQFESVLIKTRSSGYTDADALSQMASDKQFEIFDDFIYKDIRINLYMSFNFAEKWSINITYRPKHSYNATTSTISYENIEGIPFSDPLFNEYKTLSVSDAEEEFNFNGIIAYHRYDDFLMSNKTSRSRLIYPDNAYEQIPDGEAPFFTWADHYVTSFDIPFDTLVDLYTPIQEELVKNLGEPLQWEDHHTQTIMQWYEEYDDFEVMGYDEYVPAHAKRAIQTKTNYFAASVFQTENGTEVYCTLDILPEYDDVYAQVNLIYTAPLPADETKLPSNEIGSDARFIAAQPEGANPSYDAPKTWTESFQIEDTLEINVDAKIIIPDTQEYTTVLTEPVHITQEQADKIIEVLSNGNTIYEYPKEPDKDDIMAVITFNEYDAYIEEFEEADEEIPDYITELYEAYEAAPQTNLIKESDGKFGFTESLRLNGKYCLNAEYDKYDGYFLEKEEEPEWDYDTIEENAIKDIACVFETERGKMELIIRNSYDEDTSQPISHLSFSPYSAADNYTPYYSTGIDAPLETTIENAEAMLDEMGLDFTFSLAYESEIWIDGGYEHLLRFNKNYGNLWEDPYLNSGIKYNIYNDSDFTASEKIFMKFDANGLYSFSWSNPSVLAEEETAELMPWDEAKKSMIAEFNTQTFWTADIENYYYSYDTNVPTELFNNRRLEIDEIVLSYITVEAENGKTEYIPVWNLCGQLYYRYIKLPDYVDTREIPYTAFSSFYPEARYTYLTINAITGEVVDVIL